MKGSFASVCIDVFLDQQLQRLLLFYLQAPSKGKITDLVTNGRTLLQGVSDFLHSLSELEPVSTEK